MLRVDRRLQLLDERRAVAEQQPHVRIVVLMNRGSC